MQEVRCLIATDANQAEMEQWNDDRSGFTGGKLGGRIAERRQSFAFKARSGSGEPVLVSGVHEVSV